MLFAPRRNSSWCKPLFSISHSVQLFDHLLTFEHTLVAATSCDHEQQACMLAANACIKHQLNVTRSRKSCTKIAEFALVLAVLQQTTSKKPLNFPLRATTNYALHSLWQFTKPSIVPHTMQLTFSDRFQYSYSTAYHATHIFRSFADSFSEHRFPRKRFEKRSECCTVDLFKTERKNVINIYPIKSMPSIAVPFSRHENSRLNNLYQLIMMG